MELNKIYQEPCLETIKRFNPNSIDCVITSPPYWQLRDYGYDGQWGLEPTFQMYLEHLWEMMDGIYKALKPSGTVWVNLGDTYGTKSGNFTNGNNLPSKLSYIGAIENYNKPDGMDKCLLLLPHRFAIGCMERGWIVRNDIVWAKRNAMPEPCTDRFSKKHEYFFLMAKSKKYFFDMEAIRDKAAPLNRWGGNKLKADGVSDWDMGTGQNSYRDRDMQPNEGMKNPGDVADFWNIPTKPSVKQHFAQYNEALLYKPLIAGCPQFVCKKCGKPREKIIENTPMVIKRSKRRDEMGQPNGIAASGTMVSPAINKVIGLTDCNCGEGFIGGVIYDPFIGTGTTGLIALKNGRNFIGSEMSAEYCKIANEHLDAVIRQTHLF